MRAAFCVTLILVCLITVAAHRSSSSQLFGYVTYNDNSAAKGVVVTVGDFNVATNDAGYYSRRPTIGAPAGQVLQVGTDSSSIALGLHPRLTGIKQIFDQGRFAFVQRTGYDNPSRSHFFGTDIWSTADPNNSQGLGWVGRYLDSLPSPVDPLVGWNTTGSLPHVLQAHTAVPAIASPSRVAVPRPISSTTTNERGPAWCRIAAISVISTMKVERPRARSSAAPTRLNSRSTTPIRAEAAGT